MFYHLDSLCGRIRFQYRLGWALTKQYFAGSTICPPIHHKTTDIQWHHQSPPNLMHQSVYIILLHSSLCGKINLTVYQLSVTEKLARCSDQYAHHDWFWYKPAHSALLGKHVVHKNVSLPMSFWIWCTRWPFFDRNKDILLVIFSLLEAGKKNDTVD